MIFYSKISEPPYTFRLEKPEWKKGETLGDFEFPFNFFGGADTLFRRFTLWCSNIGVMTPGINWVTNIAYNIDGRENVLLFSREGSRTVRGSTPVLVGDSIDGEDVTFSENDYLRQRGVWHIRYQTGFLPPPQIVEYTTEVENIPDMLIKIDDLNKNTQKKIVDLLDDYTTQVINNINITFTLPALQVNGICPPTGGPLTGGIVLPTTATIKGSTDIIVNREILNKLKNQFIEDLSYNNDEVEKAFWR